jgi:hypothetical protein
MKISAGVSKKINNKRGGVVALLSIERKVCGARKRHGGMALQ